MGDVSSFENARAEFSPIKEVKATTLKPRGKVVGNVYMFSELVTKTHTPKCVKQGEETTEMSFGP